MKPIQLIDVKIESILGEEKKILKQLDSKLSKYNLCKEDCEEFKAALAEICINSIEHGNKEEKQKPVHVIATLKGDLIVSQIFDHGEGFMFEEKDNGDRGWGLKIVEQFVDHIEMHQLIGETPQFCTKIEKCLRPEKTSIVEKG